MSGNALADRGAIALASALWRVTKLTTPWLADAQIGPSGGSLSIVSCNRS